MMKKWIKNWLGISKIEAEIRTLNHDVICIMEKQLEGIIEDRFIRVRRIDIENKEE